MKSTYFNISFLSITLFCALLSTIGTTAQVSLSFKYQAVYRDSLGLPVENETVNIRLSIDSDSAFSSPFYTEEHTVTTNQFGLISLNVGRGTVNNGVFDNIDWHSPQFMMVEIDNGTGYQHIATTELLFGPVRALQPDSTDELNISFELTGTVLTIDDGGGTLSVDLGDLQDGVTDADADPSNEIQTLSRSGETVFLSGSGGQVSIADNDNNSANELQFLSLSGLGLTISNGNTVQLPPDQVNDADADPANEIQSLSRSGETVFLSGGGGQVSIADNDNSSSNELQTLTVSGSGLTISNGNTVQLPPDQVNDADADPTNELQTISQVGTDITLSGGGGNFKLGWINNDSVVYSSPGVPLGINTSSPDQSSIVDIASSEKGILIPRMTTQQIGDILSPAEGLWVYNTDVGCMQYFDSTWKYLCASNEPVSVGEFGENAISSNLVRVAAKEFGTGSNINHYYTCVLMENGELKCWGRNYYHQLGVGQTTSNRLCPMTTPLPGPVKSFTRSMGNVYALMEDGTVYSSGYNNYGQLGNGSTGYVYTWSQVQSLTDVVKVVASGGSGTANSACALKADGTVWCWGYNQFGQLGNSSSCPTTNCYVATPTQVNGLTGVVDIQMDGAGYASVAAIKSNGELWTWGYNGYGQLGIGNTQHQSTPVHVSSITTPVSKVISVAENSYHTRCVLLSDGSVWTMGLNESGQSGNISTSQQHTVPIIISGLTNIEDIYGGGGRYGSVFALLSDGTIRGWGRNGVGQLGINSSTTIQQTPVDPGLTNVKEVVVGGTSGYTTTCILLNDGTVKCMGYNNYGQLGNGTVAHSNVPTDVLGLNNVKEISISGYSSLTTVCAILEDGRMKCWGYNGYGQIGNGSTTHAYIPTVVKDLDE